MKTEKGQGILEYGILLIPVLVIILVIVAIFKFSGTIWDWFVGVVAGVMTGDPASVAVAAIIIIVVLYLAIRRRWK